MFKYFNASSTTQDARAAGSSASEKKEKKKKSNTKKSDTIVKMWHGLGYTMAIGFVIVAVYQATGAFSNIDAATIAHNKEIAKLQSEKEKAQQALAEKLNVTIKDDGSVIENDKTSDSNPISNDIDIDNDIDNDSKDVFNKDKNKSNNKSDNEKYYMDDNGNIIHINKNGNATVYYVCTTCSECGGLSYGTTCSKCGSDLCKYTVYQVKKGDTLSKVSGKVGASVDSIAHLNELDNVNLIYTGESLRIPQ